MLRTQLLNYIKAVNVYTIAGTVLVLPLFFLPITTDSLELPKQLFLVLATLLLLLLFGVQAILEGRSSFRRTPFDLALLIFATVIIISTIISQSRSTSIISAIPLLAIVVFAFLIINTITNEGEERLVVVSALASGSILSIFTILQFLKIYTLPYAAAQNPNFSLSGSILITTIFLFFLLPLGISCAISYLQKGRGDQHQVGAGQAELWSGFFLGTLILIICGFALGLYQIVTDARPILLPQQVGLRTALQPLGLNFQTALFGTGPGTFLFNFTQFRDSSLNLTNLWSLRFTNSSSFFLEVVSTLGVIGALNYLFLIFRLASSFLKTPKHNLLASPLGGLASPNQGWHDIRTIGSFLSVILLFLCSFLLPFSFLSIFLLFTLLSLYIVRLANTGNPHVFDVIISVVALRKGLISLTPVPSFEAEPAQREASEFLPSIVFAIFLIIGIFVAFGVFRTPTGSIYGMYQFVLSDITFQKALDAARTNQAKQTYDLQDKAIRTFQDRDLYHRVFSQTNLALANSIAQQLRTATQGADVTQNRQTLITLVQQSINFGRNAVTLSPLNVLNWENLTNVYRALIGFAQDADQFAIASAQQAIALDTTNPLLRIMLGGIYYQIGQYDLAIQQFQIAINLKNDLANAYYNLGHAFEAKSDIASLQIALNTYQTVQNLVPRDSDDFRKIETEIAALQQKIPGATPPVPATPEGAAAPLQEPLQISSPSGILPTQKPPLPVEGPPSPATTSAETQQ